MQNAHVTLWFCFIAATACQSSSYKTTGSTERGSRDAGVGLANWPADLASSASDLADSANAAGVVSFVSVVSDKIEDVSSLAAWQRAFINPDMSDADKANAVWTSVVKFRQQDIPPHEYLDFSSDAHDPIKQFNVYGYGQCDCSAAAVEALSRAVGLPARGRAINEHSVAEVQWGGSWHLYDGAYIAQFPDSEGVPAGVDEMIDAVTAWFVKNPDLKGNVAGLRVFMANGGWRNGPPLLAGCPFYSDDGLFPARVQGWENTMTEFDGSINLVTEYDYTLGYQVNNQLRQGERLTRNWSNSGHHINDDQGLDCYSLAKVPGQDDLCYSPAWGDLAPGRVGNGTIEYTLPLAGGAYRRGALVATGLSDRAPGKTGPLVKTASASGVGTLVVRMPSSYIYLGGRVAMTMVVGAGGSIAISISRNHGLDWSPVATIQASGSQTIDLTSWARRQYDYRLRFVLSGAGTGLNAVKITNDIQYSQRALPALAKGDNQISFSSGPNEGTITIEGNTDHTQTINRTFTDYHPEMNGIVDGPLQVVSKSGEITFPVATPGNLKRLRFGVSYRARAPVDGWDYQLSFDNGATFTTVDRAAGPVSGDSHFITYDKIPLNTRQALIRFAGTQKSTTEIFDLRIDADYIEPAGLFHPIQITYQWSEGSEPHEDVHVATTSSESYTIHCNGTPTMKAILLEWAP